MKTRDFYFDLPPELIAQVPPNERGTSRLMVVDRQEGSITHSSVANLSSFLPPRACLVFNDSRVRKARVFGQGDGGGQVEILFVEPIGRQDGSEWLALIRKSGSKRPGTRITLPDQVVATIGAAVDGAFHVQLSSPVDEAWFVRHGHLPLPPYIGRPDAAADEARYQTVYAQATGSAAAPTAGLHFTPELLTDLGSKGFDLAFVRLHVGLGTFAPVTAEDLEAHRMHRERYEISSATAEAINRAVRESRPVVPIGTTSLRTLESSWQTNPAGVRPGTDSTTIFMYPGYRFQSASALFTNFHTPESTLFMLVCAFGGTELMKRAYHEAIKERYRFFSYGDAMLIR